MVPSDGPYPPYTFYRQLLLTPRYKSTLGSTNACTTCWLYIHTYTLNYGAEYGYERLSAFSFVFVSSLFFNSFPLDIFICTVTSISYHILKHGCHLNIKSMLHLNGNLYKHHIWKNEGLCGTISIYLDLSSDV